MNNWKRIYLLCLEIGFWKTRKYLSKIREFNKNNSSIAVNISLVCGGIDFVADFNIYSCHGNPCYEKL